MNKERVLIVCLIITLFLMLIVMAISERNNLVQINLYKYSSTQWEESAIDLNNKFNQCKEDRVELTDYVRELSINNTYLLQQNTDLYTGAYSKEEIIQKQLAEIATLKQKIKDMQLKNSLVSDYRDSIGGNYNPETGDLKVYTSTLSDYKQVEYVSKHEIGHYIWHEDLTENQRLVWENIFKENPNYVGEYSKKSAEENFAENFRVIRSCTFNYGTSNVAVRDYFKDNIETIQTWNMMLG